MGKGNKYRETRKKLIEISNMAKKLREAENLEMTINEILLSMIYESEGAKEFNTFNQWKEKGYTVVKGSKAFLIWGQPIKQKSEKKSQDQENSGEEDEYKYFPICYLFSDQQVYKKEVDNLSKQAEPEAEPEYLPL